MPKRLEPRPLHAWNYCGAIPFTRQMAPLSQWICRRVTDNSGTLRPNGCGALRFGLARETCEQEVNFPWNSLRLLSCGSANVQSFRFEYSDTRWGKDFVVKSKSNSIQPGYR